jgi:hypothetical protein
MLDGWTQMPEAFCPAALSRSASAHLLCVMRSNENDMAAESSPQFALTAFSQLAVYNLIYIWNNWCDSNLLFCFWNGCNVICSLSAFPLILNIF